MWCCITLELAFVFEVVVWLFTFSCDLGVVFALCVYCLVVCACLMAFSFVVGIGVVGVVVMKVMIVIVRAIVRVIAFLSFVLLFLCR